MEQKKSYNKKGGYALKSAGVTRINKLDIPSTITAISKVTNIPENDLFPLGSVGKTETSGDIDLGVDINKYDQKTIHQLMVDVLGESKCVYNYGTKVASYAFPISGNFDNGLVQVDLMYVANPNWATFSYHSPDTTSKYKGAVRSILLMATATTFNEPGIDYFKVDNITHDLLIRAGRTLDLNVGLRRIFQYRPKSKKGDKYLKTMKSITADKFVEMFPDVDICGDDIVYDNPQEVLKLLFGKELQPTDVDTAEQVIDLINTNFNKDQQVAIYKKASDRATSVFNKMKLPPELTGYMDNAT